MAKPVELEIVAKPTGFEAAFQKINAQAKGSAAAVKSAFSSIQGAAAAVGIGLGIGAISEALAVVKDKTIEGERALNQMNAVLTATGKSAGLTASQLNELGQELQGKTIFDDDEIRKAETALLRFRTVQGDVFRDAIRAAPDVAAALNVDLVTAATALGRALSDPESGMKALKAAGIALSDQQKDLAQRFIESGDKASAQRIVLDELAKSIGGAGQADNAGLYGATKRMARAWDDLQKTFGAKLYSDNATSLDSITGAIGRLNEMIKDTRLNYKELFTTPGALFKLNLDVIKTLTGNNDANAPRRSVSGKISGVTPEQQDAQASAARAAEDERQEQLYKDQQAALRRRADGAATANASQLAQTKTYLDMQAALYEAGFQRNEVAISDFYDEQRRLAQEASAATVAGLTKQALAQEALLNAPSTSRDERFGIINKIQSIAAESDKERLSLKAKLQGFDLAESAAVRALTRDYDELGVALANVSGNAALAARAGFDQANRDRADRINAELNSSNPEARAAAQAASNRFAELRYTTIQQGALTDAMRQFEMTLGDVARAQQDVDLAFQSGQITELEALRATSDVRAAKIQQLREELQVARDIAETIASPEARQQALANIDALQAKLGELAATGDLVAQKFNAIGASAFTTFIKDLQSGKPLDALKALGANLQSGIIDTVATNLSQKAFGKDGIFSGFGDILGGLFGGPAGGGAVALTGSATALTASATALTASAAALSSAAGVSSLSSGVTSAAGDWISNLLENVPGSITNFLPSFDVGTDYVPRDMVAKIHRGERILTADENRRGSFGGRPVSVTINHNGPMDTRTARMLAREAGAAVSSARARG